MTKILTKPEILYKKKKINILIINRSLESLSELLYCSSNLNFLHVSKRENNE